MTGKFYLILLLLFCSLSSPGQVILYSTQNGEILFSSNAPLEDIEAKNNAVSSSINLKTREILVQVPVEYFRLRNPLMEQHFNEYYMESRRFPYATFKGKIGGTDDLSKPGSYEISSKGVLNIHGVNHRRTLYGQLKVSNKGMRLSTVFQVALADHKIKIPRVVFNKIAEKIQVSANFNYLPAGK